MEAKGLRVNMGKTKVMRCHDGEGHREATGKYPCGVCAKGVGSNSIDVQNAGNGYTRNAVGSRES